MLHILLGLIGGAGGAAASFPAPRSCVPWSLRSPILCPSPLPSPARTRGGDPAVPVAPVLACPDGWVGYHNVCYYLSRDQGSWEWSQEQCSSRGASLAVLRREWEMEFLSRLKGNIDYWIGLRRRGEHLEWVDGSSFNQTIPVVGEEPCLFFSDRDFWGAGCSQPRPYLCSKPMLQ
ncbi:PREDICTED: C-type lectin domain family 2 member B-like [Calidris pugnax]|uniref:C-type lectin domain family 2 member B-like n=1 Tax=Calidris pugnax TaxID=198806 RepID=UPI00071D4C4F|nr:PREDICTED: C-type lectin domain family 2 member B-like [Calidris pugnax]